MTTRQIRGQVAYLSGLAAETSVARHYIRSGATLVAERWRGSGGEIDIILRDGPRVIFVEVKKAATHAIAAERVSARQMARIYASASEFLASEPGGQATECQIDVALVDASGEIELLPNAIAA